jgi:hypothetical protein
MFNVTDNAANNITINVTNLTINLPPEPSAQLEIVKMLQELKK